MKTQKPKEKAGAQRKPATRSRTQRTAKAKTAQSSSKTTIARPQAPHAVAEAEAKTTTDLDEIRSWTEQRGGKPATVKGTGPEHEAGLLRIEFPGHGSDEKLEPISWEDWHDKFEEKKLAFLYQEQTKDGKESRFFKLVSRE